MYERVSPGMEAEGMGALREELLAGVAGEVVEVGAGNGMNFSHYSQAAARVIAVEPEPHLRDLAEHAAQRAPVPVVVMAGRAESLPLDPASVDVGVVVWPALTGGCRTARDPLEAIQQAGFQIERSRRLRFPDSRLPVPAAPHVIGIARRAPGW